MDFTRVSLTPGEVQTVHFVLGEEQLHLVNEQAKYVVLRGEWTVVVEEASARFVLSSVCLQTFQ